jgi:hypothetical protein
MNTTIIDLSSSISAPNATTIYFVLTSPNSSKEFDRSLNSKTDQDTVRAKELLMHCHKSMHKHGDKIGRG